MKPLNYILTALTIACAATACDDDDDDWAVGNPTMDVSAQLDQACFGDSLRFVVKASDAEVPLSTLKAELYFGEEMVSNTTIRTKVSGDSYEGRIYVPYLANIPDGRATLRLVLQNVNFTTSELAYEVPIVHPDYPSLTFVTTDASGAEQHFTMERQQQYVYALTATLPQEAKGYIVAPAYGDNGNELRFGYQSSAIMVGAEGAIPFSNSRAGKYTISFNSYSFEGSPFVVLAINGKQLEAIDDATAKVDLTLSQGQKLTPSGFPSYDEWWIDPDYFAKNDDGTLTFLPIGGTYRIIADSQLKYFRVYLLSGSEPATLNSDGSGALWVIGDNVGKPSLSANTVGWTTEKALCMAPVADKVYQLTLVGGKTISTNAINFKFFHQMGWGGEFSGTTLTSTSQLVGVGTGDNGHDNGNLFLMDGVTLEANGVYRFTVDLTQGASAGVLSVEYQGEQPFEEQRVTIGGLRMATTDNELYTLAANLTQGAQMEVTGINNLGDFWADPDYFTIDPDNASLTFLPVDGRYRVTINRTLGIVGATKLNPADDSDATLDQGAIWIMGWGIGSPSMDAQFGWTPGAAYCMAQVAPGIFRFTGNAGPEKGSSIGHRLRTDYISMKFFHQNGWGGEFSGDNALTLTDSAKQYLKDAGNFELADGCTLDLDATYVITIDISAGAGAYTLDMVKK